jgi:hypothetical protein
MITAANLVGLFDREVASLVPLNILSTKKARDGTTKRRATLSLQT